MIRPILFKKFLAYWADSTGFLRWKLRYVSRRHHLLILMYHRILPDELVDDSVQRGMFVTPDTFRLHIRFLHKYFQIVSPVDVVHGLKQEMHRPGSLPLCMITFDDGWYDFYQYAFPVIQQSRVPVTVFLPTNFIGTERWFWTDALAQLLTKRDEKETSVGGPFSSPIDPMVQQIESLKGNAAFCLEPAIRLLKEQHPDRIDSVLNELAIRWMGSSLSVSGRAFLYWDEVRGMRNSGLVSYGSHTANHPILTLLDEEEIRQELSESKNKLISEQAVDSSFIPFCYPNGSFSKEIAEMVQDTGYSMAVTTQKGWNDSNVDPYLLKRIGIHQDMTSNMAMFGCKVAAVYP